MVDIDTSERIKQKAHDLFMQYGLRNVSMDDIAQGLGISKKTIYQYYKDKDELVTEVVKGEIYRNQATCEDDRKISVNAIHEMFLAMNMVVEMFRTMNPSLLYEMQKYHPKAFQIFSNHKYQYLFKMIRENIVRGITEEVYRSSVDPDIITQYRIESMMLPLDPAFHSKLKSNLAEIQEEFIIHYLFGLASVKGHKLIVKYQKERTKKLSTDAKK